MRLRPPRRMQMILTAILALRHESERAPGKNFRSLGGKPPYGRICAALPVPGRPLVAAFALAGQDSTSWDHDTKATDRSRADAHAGQACSFGGDIDQAAGSYDRSFVRKRYAQRLGGSWRGRRPTWRPAW